MLASRLSIIILVQDWRLYIFLLNTYFPIGLFNIYFHYRYQGKHESKPPRQDPHTDNKQVYDVTTAADVFEMKSDIKQTWKHQRQQNTRYTTNHCHQQRELRQQNRDQDGKDHKHRPQRVDHHTFLDGQRMLFVWEARGYAGNLSLVHDCDECEKRKRVGKHAV